MKKLIIVFLLILSSLNLVASESIENCTIDLGSHTSEILREIKDKTLIFNYGGKMSHKIYFSTNKLDITTANYVEESGKVLFKDMQILECVRNGFQYLTLHKKKYSGRWHF